MLFDHISCTGGRLRAPSPPQRPLARGLLLLALAAVLAGPRGAAAQVGLPPTQTPAEQSAPAADSAAEEVKTLIATLEDEQARTRLAAQLRLMLAAQEAAEPSKPDARCRRRHCGGPEADLRGDGTDLKRAGGRRDRSGGPARYSGMVAPTG
jgi:hypothetical protein